MLTGRTAPPVRAVASTALTLKAGVGNDVAEG